MSVGTSYGGGPLPGLCWGQREEEGPEHWAYKASMGGGHGTPSVKAGLSAQGGGRARVHRPNRASPWASCTAPPSQAREQRGPLSALCVKAETWLLCRDLVQGTELACKLGMAGSVHGCGKGAPSRNHLPLGLLNESRSEFTHGPKHWVETHPCLFTYNICPQRP